MTLTEAGRLYEAGGADWAEHSRDERESIRAEMEAVVSAKTEKEAAKVVAWWGMGSVASLNFVREVRAAARMPLEPVLATNLERVLVERDAALAEVARLTELLGEEADQ